MSLLIKIGGSFSKNYNLILHSTIREGKGASITFPFKSIFSHVMKLKIITSQDVLNRKRQHMASQFWSLTVHRREIIKVRRTC